MAIVDRAVRRCSFCRKKQGEVRLVAGPSDVYICHLCVALCNEILAQEASGDRPPDPPGQPRNRGPLVRPRSFSPNQASGLKGRSN